MQHAAERHPTGPAEAPGFAVVWSRLAKARLSLLVLATTAVGFVVAPAGAIDWLRLLWTCLGTAMAAASAAMLNQLAETSYKDSTAAFVAKLLLRSACDQKPCGLRPAPGTEKMEQP